MYIPIIHFLKNIPHQDFSQITELQTKLFKFWFWGSLLNTRYGGGMVGSTNDIIVEDCKMLENIANGKNFSRDYLKQFKFDFSIDDLLELTSKGAIFTGIMAIMNYKNKGFKNLGNHNLVDFKNQINVHHIFPTKYLEKTFKEESFENEYSDSILNKMIIEKIPNIKFGDKKPSDYLRELYNTQILTSLESHYIPEPEKLVSGYFDNEFEEFVRSRAKILKELIDSEIGSIKLKLLDELEKK